MYVFIVSMYGVMKVPAVVINSCKLAVYLGVPVLFENVL